MQNVVLGFVLFFVNFLFIGCSTGAKQKPDFIAQKVYDNQNLPKYDSHIESKTPNSNLSLSRLIFTCCNSDLNDQSGWRNIAQKKPDLVVLVGNTVNSVRLDQKPLYKQYQILDQNSAYTELRKDTPFMAVWDDLDYGLRFGDSAYPNRENNRDYFMEYWKYISAQQKNPTQGTEHAMIFGPKGQRVQIIMLDLRFYATAWSESSENSLHFKKNWKPSATILGNQQWQWLSRELQKPADLRIIVSPLQVGANSLASNRWGLLPLQRQRLFDTLRSAHAKNAVVISGNRNFAAFSKVDLKNFRPLYDMTVGPLNGETSTPDEDFHYIEKPLQGHNFGMVDLDWKKRTATLQLVDGQNNVVQSLPLKF